MELLMWNKNKLEAKQLSDFFISNGFNTSFTDNFNELRSRVLLEAPDLILLSVDSSMKNGLKLCQLIKSKRHTEDTFVVFMSNRKEEEIQILGLEAGADDFLFFPITHRLCLKRVHALLRRKKVKSIQKTRN